MRCVVCINLSLNGQDLSTDTPVLLGAAHSNDAVVVADGKSLCVKHYHEHLMNQTMQEISKALGEK